MIYNPHELFTCTEPARHTPGPVVPQWWFFFFLLFFFFFFFSTSWRIWNFRD